jgi:mono/diheme cytochrome c family protein
MASSRFFRRAAGVVVICGVLAGAGALGVYGVNRWQYEADIDGEVPAPAATAEQVEHGHYLALAGDCVACHTAAGGKPYAGGLPLDTGFGIVVASNITPDRETGIGGWTTKQFILAVRNGIGDHGKRLYPAMPYNDYARVSDADLADIKAYLDTVPPVRQKIESNQMPFPFNIRLAMMGWNLLFYDSQPYQPVAGQSAEWNRGAYLVQGLGHCATCHTPKNLLGGDKGGQDLQGFVLQGWYAPNITNAAHDGLRDWSVDDIAAFLKTGGNDHAVASGPMAEAVANSTQYLSDADLHAIGVYLKSRPGNAAPVPAAMAATDPRLKAGAAIYADNCAACHMTSGQGVAGMVSGLSGSAAVQAPTAINLLHTILVGGHGAATDTNPTGAAMPPFSWKLTDAEIAAVTSYIRNSWGNSAGAVTADDVKAVRQDIKAQQPIAPIKRRF